MAFYGALCWCLRLMHFNYYYLKLYMHGWAKLNVRGTVKMFLLWFKICVWIFSSMISAIYMLSLKISVLMCFTSWYSWILREIWSVLFDKEKAMIKGLKFTVLNKMILSQQATTSLSFENQGPSLHRIVVYSFPFLLGNYKSFI